MAKKQRPVREKRSGAFLVVSAEEKETALAEMAATRKELRRLNNLIETIRKSIAEILKKKGK